MKRIYVVEDTKSGDQALVRANTQAEAIRIIVSPRYKAEVADQDRLVQLIQSGMKVVGG